MELLYLWVPSKWDQALRYSLRSVVKHYQRAIEYVTIVTAPEQELPWWLTNVNHVRVEIPTDAQFDEMPNILLEAGLRASVTPKVLLMLPCYYILRPGLLRKTVAAGKMTEQAHKKESPGMVVTRAALRAAGLWEPYDYRTNTPVFINRWAALQYLEKVGYCQHFSTTYFNSAYGSMAPDVLLRESPEVRAAFFQPQPDHEIQMRLWQAHYACHNDTGITSGLVQALSDQFNVPSVYERSLMFQRNLKG